MELLKNLEGLSADEQMTAVVELQKAAMKHLEEQKQASIGKSAELVIQGLKKIKSDFEAKFDSLNYDIQTKVANLKDGEQGLQGPKGDQGDRGLDGSNGRDGRDGKDGRDGLDGQDGVGVRDAKIDFDGSLVITLTDGREINVGEVVSVDVAKQIQKVTHNIQTGAGGDSQTVLDAIATLQATIATYGTMATQNANNVAITGGTINNTTIGATTPSTGVFTTLGVTTSINASSGSANADLNVNSKGTGVIKFSNGGGEAFRTLDAGTTSGSAYWTIKGSSGGFPFIGVDGTNPNISASVTAKGSGGIQLVTNNGGNVQAFVSHTASAVNYVQVTGAATTLNPTFTSTGSDANVGFDFRRKGGGTFNFYGDSYLGVNGNNSWLIGGAVTGLPPRITANGSDTNISAVFQSKGTGAIDLAAGSSGVNISNGGTVTAITRTNAGSGYTSFPTPAISAPTTAGGVQATATVTNMFAAGVTIAGGGTGYTVNNVLTVSGGTPQTSVQLTVSTVSAGVITAVTISTAGAYTALPTNPVSVTGGTGSGATFNLTWSVIGFTITNAGSGYVEQPTVTFSGGGGSGAAAYATVGSVTTIKSLGSSTTGSTLSSIQFVTPNNSSPNYPPLTIRDIGGADTGILISPNTGYTQLIANHASSGILMLGSFGSSSVYFNTNGTSQTNQMRVSHTASAVNYVQVTGAATGASPTISAQGSDTNIPLTLNSKGNNGIVFQTRGGGTPRIALQLLDSGSASVNYLQIQSNISGAGPVLSALGTDTNIDLNLTPKGTGVVQFGSYTASALLAVAGYITIKDSGGTTRRLLVG